jgi:hypothetical protein
MTMIRMKAPAQTTIQASATGLTYNTDAEGFVTVDQRDVADLLRARFTVVETFLEEAPVAVVEEPAEPVVPIEPVVEPSAAPVIAPVEPTI